MSHFTMSTLCLLSHTHKTSVDKWIRVRTGPVIVSESYPAPNRGLFPFHTRDHRLHICIFHILSVTSIVCTLCTLSLASSVSAFCVRSLACSFFLSVLYALLKFTLSAITRWLHSYTPSTPSRLLPPRLACPSLRASSPLSPVFFSLCLCASLAAFSSCLN
jgi:hypothetical protein